MSLTSTLNIGRSALTASQVGIQVAGNNMANATTPGYSRQVGSFTAIRGDRSLQGISIGLGVQARDVRRQVDSALTSRQWLTSSEQAAASTQYQILSQIETALGELGDNDLSSELSSFFSTWSESANGNRSPAVVVQQGEKLSTFARSLRSSLSDQRRQIEEQLSLSVREADQLLDQIAKLNGDIYDAEGSGSIANVLRDQRDELVSKLSSLLDVSVIDRGQQGMDVLVGSTPVVMGSESRGIELRRESDGGRVVSRLLVSSSQTEIQPRSGQIGALANGRSESLDATIEALDTIAAQVIFQTNRIHSTGRNLNGFSHLSGTLSVRAADRNLAMNDGANASFANLPFAATDGGFTINVRNPATGSSQSVRIDVDLDGLTSAGLPGTTDDATPESIRAAIDAVPGIAARFTEEGKLEVTAQAGHEFSFLDDSSGLLAVMGVNAYFVGTGASDIGVRPELVRQSSLLATGRDVNGTFVENGNSLRIAGLQSAALTELDGRSITESWRDSAQGVGSQTSAAKGRSDAAAVVSESLAAQRAAVSGVSLDEEAVNLLNYQRQYQGAARLISVADQLTQTILGLV